MMKWKALLLHVSCWNLSRIPTSNASELITWNYRWIGGVKQPDHSLLKNKMAQNCFFENPSKVRPPENPAFEDVFPIEHGDFPMSS